MNLLSLFPYSYLKLQAYLAFDSTAMFSPTSPNSKRIMILRPDGIGDYLIFLDALSGIRKRYPRPDYELCLVGNSAFASLAKVNQLIDRVISISRSQFISDFGYRHKVIRKIRRSNFGIVLYPVHNRDLLGGDLLVRSTGALKKIAFAPHPYRRAFWEADLSKSWYTQMIDGGPLFEHELQRNSRFVQELGMKNFKSSNPILELPSKLEKKSKLSSHPYFVIFPGAGWSKRAWPIKYFSELAKEVTNKMKLKIVICGGPNEMILGKKLEESFSLLDLEYDNLIGQTTLVELAQIIKEAHFIVSNDTSAIHLSSAVGTVGFCLLGGGNKGRFLPYRPEKKAPVLIHEIQYQMDCFGCHWDCIYDAKALTSVPCIENISVKSVLDTIYSTL